MSTQVWTGKGFVHITRLIDKSEVNAGFLKLKERQKAFQIDNLLGVHESGGPEDKLLDIATLLVGTILGFKMLGSSYRGIFGEMA